MRTAKGWCPVTDPNNDDALVTAKNLTGAVTGLAGEVKRLRNYGRFNRKFILFDIALTILLAGVGAVSVHATQTASHASSAQLALCKSGNEARAQQIGLWDYLIKLSPPPPTAQARERLAKFEHHLNVIFAPRNCSHLGK